MRLLVIIYLLLLPMQWALSPTSDIDLALSRVLALIIIGTWIFLSLMRRSVFLPQPLVLFFSSSFLLLATASYFWAENQDWAIRKIIFLWNFFPLLVVFSSITKEKYARENIIKAFVIGSAVASFIGITQFLSQFIFGVETIFAFWTRSVLPFFLGISFGESVANYPSLLVNISGLTLFRASAFFPDPHMFSLYLGLAVPFSLFLVATGPRHLRTLSLIASLLIITADLLTFSRGGYLGLITGIGIGVFLFYKQSSAGKKLGYTLLGGLVMTIICFTLSTSPIGSRLVSSFSSEDNSNIERLRLWQETVGYIVERPLLGTGIGNYPLLAKPSAHYREPIYAHNLFLDITAETGLLGLISFIGTLCIAFQMSLLSWIRHRDTFALASYLALIIFSIHSLFELPLFSVHVLPIFLLVISLANQNTEGAPLKK